MQISKLIIPIALLALAIFFLTGREKMKAPLPDNQSSTSRTCKIVGVSDGDTATCLLDDKTQIKIRLAQIDAPESGQDFGQVSKHALSDMIYGRVVSLKISTTDRYGRTVAEVFIDETNVNKQMVAQGMAWAYREYNKDKEYLDLENKAKQQKLGLWSQPEPIYPSEFRKK